MQVLTLETGVVGESITFTIDKNTGSIGEGEETRDGEKGGRILRGRRDAVRRTGNKEEKTKNGRSKGEHGPWSKHKISWRIETSAECIKNQKVI